MVQFGEVVKRIDQLLNTKLDEFFLAILMIGISAVALFLHYITPDVWERITYVVLGIFSGSAAVRTVKGTSTVQTLRDVMAKMFDQGGPTPPAPPAAPAR